MKYLHTMVRVTDIDASLDFYCNKLGLIELKRYDSERGRFTLVFLAAPGDEFRSLFAEQIRVLDLDQEGLYRQRVFRQLEGQWRQFGPDIEPRLDGRRMTRIPFIIFGPRGNRPAVAKPPLLDLVNVNLSHYRTTADFEHGAHFTGLPTAVITGHRLDEGEGLAIGAGEAWVLPAPDAKAFFLEFSGQGLGALSDSLAQGSPDGGHRREPNHISVPVSHRAVGAASHRHQLRRAPGSRNQEDQGRGPGVGGRGPEPPNIGGARGGRFFSRRARRARDSPCRTPVS